jgi:multidrug transporter EmrE-like cation transporter
VTSRGLLLLILISLCTVAANLSVRGGILQAGGFVLSMSRMKNEVLGLCRQPLFDTGMVLYAVAAILWFRVLSTEDLSLSYPLLVSLTFILVTVGGAVFFKEHISLQRVFGIAVMLAGFVVSIRT